MLNKRMSVIDSSGIRKVFDLAAKIDNPINLSIGQPDFDVPDEIKEASINAIRKGKNRYTLTQGITELREAVREFLEKEKKIPARLEEVVITSGVSGALVLAFLALFGEGDEIIIPDPYFVMYKHLLRLFGATPVYADTYPDFKLTAERIEPLISSKTRAIIAGSPSNPTGAVIIKEDWIEIVELAKKKNLLIISDEIYDSFVYDAEIFSPGSIYENVLTMGGFSKSHAMTGWRLGYTVGPKEIISAMITVQQYSFVCAPSMVQEAGLTALKVDTSEKRELYRKKRNKLIAALKNKYKICGGQGAFYLFVEVPKGTAAEFCQRAITEEKLLIIPGNVFSERDTHFRISYAASDETLERGIAALNKLA